MKKIVITTLISASSMCSSCRKDAPELPEDPAPVTSEQVNGIPEQPDKISAYLYAGYRRSLQPTNTYTQTVAFAFFGDPPRDLSANTDRHLESGRSTKSANTPNVSVGNMIFNGRQLSSSGSVFYSGFHNSGSGTVIMSYAHWESEGNKTFESLNMTVARGFPMYIGPVTTFTAKIKQGLTFDMNAMFTNFDSVAVKLTSTTFPVTIVHKCGSRHSPTISFSKTELDFLKNYYSGQLQLSAFNYSHKTIKDKVHFLELGGRIDQTIVIDTTSK